MDFIAEILSIFIEPLYKVLQNYGWTIIVFTVVLKLVTMPFTIKSQKSMARMQQVQPLISEVQRKYANNREKQQEELMKIYDKYEISPTGGCMPMILQLVILMGFIQVVYKPYTFILGIGKDVISAAAQAVNIDISKISNQLILNTAEYRPVLDKLAEDGINTNLNLDFLGIDLTKVLSENWKDDITLWILPIIALALTIISTVVSQRSANAKQNENQKKDPQAQQAQAMTKSMYVMMPLMTAWITFTMPLGCALYWSISTLTQMIQQFIVNEFVVKKMKPINLKKKKKTSKPKAQEVIDVKENKED